MLQAIEFVQSHTREHFTPKPAPEPEPLIPIQNERRIWIAFLYGMEGYDENRRPWVDEQTLRLPSRAEMQGVCDQLALLLNTTPTRVGCHVIGDAE